MATLLASSSPASAITLPPGFERVTISSSLVSPTAIAFAPDGRVFVAEQRGTVRVFVDNVMQERHFIDLRDEVAGAGYRGLLGIAVDPNFLVNRYVYLAFTVDPIPGEPDENDQTPTFNRLVRYTGTVESAGMIADLDSRTVLIGATPVEGIPACWAHTVDCLRFGLDGTLLVSCGDGGHYEIPDGGGHDPGCFQPPLFGANQDIGAFRAQYLNSMNGKILRIDPTTGFGLQDNPYWNGDPTSARSRVWVSGLRNPFRFCVRPMTQPGSATLGPGELFIGDVGWNDWEEINIASAGGGNFGWPCWEGLLETPEYPAMTPSSAGCATIGTPANPGPLMAPVVAWSHSVPGQSTPPGLSGFNAIGGVFYAGSSYPQAYRGAFFFADHVAGWIKVLRVNGQHELINLFDFATQSSAPVDIAAEPVSGDLFYLAYFSGQMFRITYDGPGPGDVDGNGEVNVDDLIAVILAWGDCWGGPPVCPGDIDGSGQVDVDDLLVVILHWG
jgi:glucose/arabinose dehydrogenase